MSLEFYYMNFSSNQQSESESTKLQSKLEQLLCGRAAGDLNLERR
jgi:hypothetical protein